MTANEPVEQSATELAQAAANLHAFLQAHPDAVSHVLDILRRRLDSELNPQTWQVLHASLAYYLGPELDELIAWTLQPGQGDRLQELEKHASPQVLEFFRTILGLYGQELDSAYTVWNEVPDNWRTIYREVYYDQLTKRHLLKVRIEKYSGESMTIEGPPDSILALTSYLILTLRLVGVRDAFGQESAELFLSEADQLIRVLQREKDMVRLLQQKEPAQKQEAAPA